MRQGDKEEGRAYLKRLAQLGSAVGLSVAAIILLGRYQLPFLFTNEAVVGQTVANILPIIGFLMVPSRAPFLTHFRCTRTSSADPATHVNARGSCRV